MKRPQIALMFLIACVVLAGVRPAHAQRSWPYRPSRPTLSPWFGLYQYNPGPLSNYRQHVLPEIERRDTLRRQDLAIGRQSAGLRSLGQQMSRFERASSMRPTGTGSVFMNYSHYYQFQGSYGRRR